MTLVSSGPDQINTEKGYYIHSFVFSTTYTARKP
jgi:hypothetical protein